MEIQKKENKEKKRRGMAQKELGASKSTREKSRIRSLQGDSL